MEGSQKKWPIELIRRGKRLDGSNPEVVWWQEPEPEGSKGDIVISTVAAARSLGYEAHALVPIAYPERLAGSAENLLAKLKRLRVEHEVIEDLELVVRSYRDNVQRPLTSKE